MQDLHELPSQDRYPKYSIYAAARLTGLKPGTLRAWERRYRVPSPGRSPSGHRLYAEYDLRTVRWLATQKASGMTIGRAADFLRHLQSLGQDPISRTSPSQGPPNDIRTIKGEPTQDEQT
jgi:DNA-binding transcriptional MerR regulator